MALFEIKNLSFSYSGSYKKALVDINLTIESGSFSVICGQSGCGKTTLLRLLKRELAPKGKREGEILFDGKDLFNPFADISAAEIGYVMQNPENQTVTDKVWHELAFGAENLGLSSETIRRRVGEMASFFGIEGWFRSDTMSLSGGQKQLLALASVMVMSPKVLLLDEPTSQLDPIAAADFIAVLGKLNKELGLTIIIVEHRLEELLPICDNVIVMRGGKIDAFAPPEEVSRRLSKIDKAHPMLEAMPTAVRLYTALSDGNGVCPLTVRDGKSFVAKSFKSDIKRLEKTEKPILEKIAVKLHNIWFRYERELPDIIRGVNFEIFENEIFTILGGNGAGKTTLLNVIAGLKRQYRGTAEVFGKKTSDYKGGSLYRGCLAFLPQNPQSVFLKSSVKEDLTDICKKSGLSGDEIDAAINGITEKTGISALLSSHPYDLSGGEQQKCGIAKTLLLKPKILLLDEPTKGIDAFSKKELSRLLRSLVSGGMTIVAVTHDVEFAGETADRCAMLFDGEIMCCQSPSDFFDGNGFYTTAANRIARGLYEEIVTARDLTEICKANGMRDE